MAFATPYEQPQDWQDHRAAILQRLAPADHLETVLAEHIALLLWRKGRVGRAEAGLIARDQLRLAAATADRRFPRPDGAPSTLADLAAERAARAETLRYVEGWPDLEPTDALDACTASLLLTGFVIAATSSARLVGNPDAVPASISSILARARATIEL